MIDYRRAQFCSDACVGVCKSRRTCPGCGRDFCVWPSSANKTCSYACAAAVRFGNHPHLYSTGLQFRKGRYYIFCRDGCRYPYARALMEAHLGRELDDAEVVHHINGDRTDDRIENLEVVTRAAHMEIHRLELLEARKEAVGW